MTKKNSWQGGAYLASVLTLCGLLMTGPAYGKSSTYRQPAYITNAYFSDRIKWKGQEVPHGSLINVLQSDTDKEVGSFIMDLLLQAGHHQLSADITDSEDKKLGEMIYNPIHATQDDYVYTLIGIISGPYPQGRIFIKIYDRLNKGKPVLLATYSILVRGLPPKGVQQP